MSVRRATSVRVLGVCGLLASLLAAASGYFDAPVLLGLSGTVMVGGNVYAMLRG